MDTEKEMKEAIAPTFGTIEELQQYINGLVTRDHDYGTCVYAMSLAAVASFNFVASKLGVTGFQASCADLDILRRTRHLDCPFVIISADNELYPQYDNVAKLQECRESWSEWVSNKAKVYLEDKTGAATSVIAHWEKLAAT